MEIALYLVVLIFSLLFYNEGVDHWGYNEKSSAIVLWLMAIFIFALSIYKLVYLL